MCIRYSRGNARGRSCRRDFRRILRTDDRSRQWRNTARIFIAVAVNCVSYNFASDAVLGEGEHTVASCDESGCVRSDGGNGYAVPSLGVGTLPERDLVCSAVLPAYGGAVLFSIPVYWLVSLIRRKLTPKEQQRLEKSAQNAEEAAMENNPEDK